MSIRVAIIGMGNMGCGYARMITSGTVTGAEIVAVTRIRPERMDEVKELLEQNVPVYQTADDLYADVRAGKLQLDAVIIATPHKAHEKQMVEAMELGLHVLCDKPAGVYSRQARIMAEAAGKHPELIYAMVFNQRMNPVYHKMKEIIESGIYGKMKRINWIMSDWYRPDVYYKTVAWHGKWATDGGGLLLNQCPHNLDLLQWVCGMPISVQAFCKEGKYHDIEVEDELTAYLEFENGVTGIFYSTTGEALGINRLEISLEDALLVCEKGKMRVRELGFHEPDYRHTATLQFEHFDGTWKDIPCEKEDTKHAGIVQNFINAVHGTEPLFVEGVEGSKSLLLANAMYLSSWKKQMVNLPVTIEENLLFESEFEKELEKKIEEYKDK